MKKTQLPLLLLAIGLVIIAAIWLNSRPNDQNDTSPISSTNKKVETIPASDIKPNIDSTLISYDGKSFSPAKVSITSGELITIKNTSESAFNIQSDPHPGHNGNAELNIGFIEPGQNRSVFIKKAGTWGYHDEQNPTAAGSVVVK